jgi:hypothetical protein
MSEGKGIRGFKELPIRACHCRVDLRMNLRVDWVPDPSSGKVTPPLFVLDPLNANENATKLRKYGLRVRRRSLKASIGAF